MPEKILKRDYSKITADEERAKDVAELTDILSKLAHKDISKEDMLKINRHVFSTIILAQDMNGSVTLEKDGEEISISIII